MGRVPGGEGRGDLDCAVDGRGSERVGEGWFGGEETTAVDGLLLTAAVCDGGWGWGGWFAGAVAWQIEVQRTYLKSTYHMCDVGISWQPARSDTYSRNAARYQLWCDSQVTCKKKPACIG